MPGSARTDSFLLSSATVMFGTMADLYNLNPTAHSVGMVKNFQVTSTPTALELTQGIRNSVVMSLRTADDLKASFEAYEFTYRNLAYSSGFDASGAGFAPGSGTNYSTNAVIAANATTLTIATDVTTNFPVGSWIFIQNGTDDYVHIAKVASRAFATNTTITFTGFPTPVGTSFPIGTRVGVVPELKVGGSSAQANLSAKVIGVMPKDNRPIVIMFPKVKVTKGFQLQVNETGYANMPFEFTPYSCVSTDPFFTDFDDAPMKVFPSI